MDTKLKNIKYSLWTKGLCLFLSVVLVALSGFTLASAMRTMVFYGGAGALTGKIPPLVETSTFQEQFLADVNAVSKLTVDVQAIADTLEVEKATAVSKMTENYLSKKADIIKNELLYVAKIDYSGFSGNRANLYNGTGGETRNDNVLQKYQAIIAELEKDDTSPDWLVIADRNAPLNIYAAQLIVNGVKGQNLLQYENLVRTEAFNNVSFYADNEYGIDIKADENERPFRFDPDIQGFSYTEQEIAGRLAFNYDSMAKSYTKTLQSSVDHFQTLLNDRVNFKYFVKNDTTGATIGNVESDKGLSDGRLRFAMVNGTVTEDEAGEQASSLMVGNIGFSVYFWVENTFMPGDTYYTLADFYQKTLEHSVNQQIAIASAALLISILAFITLLCLSGHKNTEKGITRAFIDKFPWDLHFIISGSLCSGLIAAILAVSIGLWRSGLSGASDTDSLELALSPWLPTGVAVTFAAIALILIELTASAVRIKKSGKPWIRSFAVVRLTVWVFCRIVKFCNQIFKTIAKLLRVFTYKPKKLRRLAILSILLYAAVNFIFILLCFASPVFVLFVIALNAVVLYFVANYTVNLDKIIIASVERSEFVAEGKVSQSLAMIADSLSFTNAELNRAIGKAVRDERMKTELITNVSHDLKTPLTSIITYIDLLKKLDIQNDDAQNYITILEEKADKLKHLIDDLIEASKVSTGNVALNPINLNLAELTVQAIVEATPDFEKNNLDIRFDESEKSPIVFADSQKTYRILENLLSNARKYSAPGTRVYIRVLESDGFGVFEVKNISKEPLNISSEELMERFVRGDRSRNEEGNGLGLSIAKELTVLQNGSLTISIDGDLFKAEVLLPLGK